ncbi:MAG: hypothetical protein HY738_12795 [Bacteroidia bacterium]|nr:hypothetical protein [Bacteroidia bacterium]
MKYYKKEVIMCDSIANEENYKKTMRQQAKYDYGKKAAVDSIAHTKAMEIKNLEIKRQEAVSSRQRVVIWFVVCGLLLVVGFAVVLYNRFRIIRRQKDLIQKQKTLVDEKNVIIEQKNKDITDNINYAKRIQEAILTSSEYCKKILPQHFILFKPKDIVSGDFYWAYAVAHPKMQVGSPPADCQLPTVIWTVADCTGHGVPGAFMSMIGSSLLNEIIIENGITTANIILNELKSKKLIEVKAGQATNWLPFRQRCTIYSTRNTTPDG